MKTALITGFILMTFFGVQTDINLDQNKSKMIIQGTSSIHDWESEVNQFAISGAITPDKIQNLHVKVHVNSIESGKSIMDDKTYEALEESSFPVIEFKAPSLAISNGKVSGTGTLTIAGKTKTVPVSSSLSDAAGQKVVKGKMSLKMSEFGIEPPTAMFGSLKTADDVTVQYEIYFK